MQETIFWNPLHLSDTYFSLPWSSLNSQKQLMKFAYIVIKQIIDDYLYWWSEYEKVDTFLIHSHKNIV